MTSYRLRAAVLRQISRSSSRSSTPLRRFPSSSRTARRRVSEHFLFVDGPLFDVLQLPFLSGDRDRSGRARAQLVLTETEARRRFGTDRRDRPDADASSRAGARPTTGSPAWSRIRARQPPRSVDGRPLRSADLLRRPGAISSPSGCRRTAGSMRGSGPASTSPTSPGRCRPGRSATSPTRSVGGERFNSGDNHRLAADQRPRRPSGASRSAAGCGRATTGGRSSPSRHRRRADPGHGAGSTSSTSPPPAPASAPARSPCARCSARRAAS